MDLEADLRLDLLVEDLIVVEIKAVEALSPIYEAQVLSYMRLLEKPKEYYLISVRKTFSRKVRKRL